MAAYHAFLNHDEKQILKDIDDKKARLKARNAEYTKQKAAIVHAATERRRNAEARQKR